MTNVTIARLFGVSESLVSRYRSGNRAPSKPWQAALQKHMDWTRTQQLAAIAGGTYLDELEEVLSRWWSARADAAPS